MAVVTPTIKDIFEESFERIGKEMRSGYDIRTARRSFNLLMLEWQNRGLNLFTIEEGTQALTAGTASYTLPTDTIDLIEYNIRTGSGTNQIDQNLERISVSTYADQSAKNIQGRPSQIYIQRKATSVTATLWPVPDSVASYTLVYYRLAGIDGISNGISGSADIPPRFVPALIAGMAFNLAMKFPDTQAIAPALKQEYESQYALAAEEDQENADMFIAPFVGF